MGDEDTEETTSKKTTPVEDPSTDTNQPDADVLAKGCADAGNGRIALAILSYNRPGELQSLIDSIEFGLVNDVLILVDGGGGVSYEDVSPPKGKGVTVKYLEANLGVAKCKNLMRAWALTSKCSYIYLLEDDVVVTDNDVWAKGLEWSAKIGIHHWNWNNYRYGTRNNRCFGEDYKVCENTEANFSYFSRELLKKFPFDVGFYNAYEHVDQELRMSMRGYAPPFWYFVQPPFVEQMLESQDAESGIDQSRILSAANTHWIDKHGFSAARIGKPKWREMKDSLTMLKSRFGTPAIVKGVRRQAVVVTLKDRMVIQYKKPEDLTPQEIQTFATYDQSLSPLKPQYEHEPNFRLNREVAGPPKFMYRQFLDSFLYWTSRLENIETVMCVSDFESTDGDPEELLADIWGNDGRFIKLKAPGGDQIFNRGLGLNEAAAMEEDADYYFFTDVDCVLTANNMMEHGSSVTEQGGVLFPIFHKEMSPNGVFRYVEWAGNGQSFVPRGLHEKVGGFPEYWTWGKEDSDFRQRLVDVGACVIVDDYPDLVHSWHSEKRRDTK